MAEVVDLDVFRRLIEDFTNDPAFVPEEYRFYLNLIYSQGYDQGEADAEASSDDDCAESYIEGYRDGYQEAKEELSHE